MKLIIACLFVVSYVLAGPVQSKVVAHSCATSSCTNLDMRHQAQQLGRGYHYIYDLRRGVLTRWYVSTGLPPTVPTVVAPSYKGVRPAALPSGVKKVAVPASVASWWARIMAYYATAHTLRFHVDMSYQDFAIVSSSGYMLHPAANDNSAGYNRYSAWDVVDQSPEQRAFLSDVKNIILGDGFTGWASASALDAGKALLNGPLSLPDAKFLVTVHMKDDTEITVSWDFNTNGFKVVKGTAYDQYGNKIPSTLQGVSNGRYGQARYEYPNTTGAQRTFEEFKLRVSRWGIPVTGSKSKKPVKAVVCTGTKKGKVCVVTVYYQ